MKLREPVHYYTEALHLCTDSLTKATYYHNCGIARYDIAEFIRKGNKPKELILATTINSVYKTLSIKLDDGVKKVFKVYRNLLQDQFLI